MSNHKTLLLCGGREKIPVVSPRMPTSDDGPSVSRRGLLAVLATAGTGGCLQRARSVVNHRSPEQVSVTIKTVPADDDAPSVEIARRLQERMADVGIDARIEPEDEAPFHRSILINGDFDVYVGQFPARTDPDFLRPTLHSAFISEPGWQNPFGFSDLDLDGSLLDQRVADGSARRGIVGTLLESVAELQPFSVVCFPEEAIVVRTDRFRGWPRDGRLSPLDYLTLRHRENGEEPVRLAVASTDGRITQNLNPIAVEYRRNGTITGLLYDPLARRDGDSIRPWIADDIAWSSGDAGRTATLSLRDGATWHDGRPLTGADVAFTYRFFDDTSLGEGDVVVPAPRFRGRSSLVESATALDERTVRLTFGETSQSVAERALTVPILPRHVWEEQTGSADLAGVDLTTAITDALVWPNTDPVGSGPLKFASRTAGEELVLSVFESHFLFSDPPTWADAVPAFDELAIRVAPSNDTAVALVTQGEVEATATPVRPSAHDAIDEAGPFEAHAGESRSFYHIGYNTRREPFGNVRFRRVLSRLLDPQTIATAVFDGDATPAATPLAGTDWEPMDLAWGGSDPVVPFLGSDGELDVSAAKEAFREAGFRYDSDRLIR